MLKKKHEIFLCLLFIASSTLSWAEVLLDKNQPYDKLSGEIVTTHIKWAHPYYQGKVKVLVIAPILGQRETIELAQRLSLNYTPLMTYSYNKMYQDPERPPHSVPAEKADLIIREKLKKNYDVIIIGKVSWKMLPDYLRTWIKGQVYKGTGLVYICPHGCKEIEPLFVSEKTTDKERFVIDSVPLKELPVLRDLEVKKIFGFSLFGKGRVIKIDYGEKQFRGLHSLTPVNAYENWSLNYDYYHSLLAKAVLWAACREPDIHIKEMKIKDNLLTVRILDESTTNRNTQVELVVRDRDNHIELRQTRRVRLSKGMQDISFKVPPLKAGLHFLDIWVKERGKILNWKSTSLKRTAKCSIEKLVLDKESYEFGDVIKGKIVFSQTPDKDSRLKIQLLDNFDRIMVEKTLESLGKEVGFSFKIKEALSLLLKIEAKLFNDRQVICDIKKEFPVVQRKIDDYFLTMWVGPCDNHVGNLLLKLFYEYGVDFDYSCRHMFLKSARANLGIIPYFSGSFFPGYGYMRMKQGATVRKPCFTDPNFRKRLKSELQRKTKAYKKYGGYYSLSINGGISPLRCIPLDVCFSPTCQEHFREYLKKEYKNLNEINREWETSYKSWDEVKPMTFAEAKEHKNFAPWADHRMHMEDVFTEINLFAKKVILETDPEAVVGLDEPNMTSSYNGYNWWDLMNTLDFCNPYFGKWHWRDDQRELSRCFVKKENIPSGIWFGTYWRGENFNRFIPWQSLFNGMKGVFWWEGVSQSFIGALGSDFAPLPYFSQALEEINEIKEGIGKLLINSKRSSDKIAIHYSPSCVHAATIETNTGTLPPKKFPEERLISDCVAPPDTPTQFGSSYPLYQSQQVFITVVEDIGFQHNFVSNEQIEAGELEKNNYKILILPYAKALSSLEAKKIKQFIQLGGLVIADHLPGIMDEHCKKLKDSLLKEVFKDSPKGLKVNTYGNGKTVCLHDFLEDYVSLRLEGKEGEKRGEIKKIIKLAGMEPRLRILTSDGSELGNTEVVFFKHGHIEYVGLLKDYLIKDKSGKEVIVEFPYEAHIYDVRKGKYYGWTKRIKTKISPARAKVFALVPYKVNGISLSVDKRKYEQGENLLYTIAVKTSSNDISPHTFRLKLINPKGKIIKHYSMNILAKKGAYSGVLHLSLNEQEGRWSLQAKDVMSGKTATCSFLVETR